MTQPIDRFDGEYAFLSNFYSAPVYYNGLCYPNNEAAFQAQKCPQRAVEFTAPMTPGQAKRLGRNVPMRSDWNNIRIGVMTDLVRNKFTQHAELAEKLLATGDRELIEGNYWHDEFWGVCNGRGRNCLGRILMQIRSELRYAKTVARITDNGMPAKCPFCGGTRLFQLRIDSDWTSVGEYTPVNQPASCYQPEDLNRTIDDRPDIDLYHCLDCHRLYEPSL